MRVGLVLDQLDASLGGLARWTIGFAGAAGLPVITTTRNGAAELIREGETGFVLADPEDAGALAAAMRRLLDPALCARMGEAARRAAPAHDVVFNYAAVEAILETTRRGGNGRAASA